VGERGPLAVVRRIGVSYLVLSALLVAYAAVQAVREPWDGDFWEHAAVVRELATRPLDRLHPLLGIDAPDAFSSPYSLIPAGISRLLGVDSVRALGIAGVLNMILLVAGLRLFVEALAPARATRASFFALLFSLLLWGWYPWAYSGFFNLTSIGYVAPYASTFAAGLAMVAIFVWSRRCLGRSRSFWALAFVAVSAGTILATHPPVFLLLAAGMFAFALAARPGISDWFALAGALALAGGLAAAWPYYPVWTLLLSEQATFHESNVYMYRRVLERIAPAFLAVPFVIRSWWRNRRHPIAVMAAILSVVYVYGGLTKRWNLGRALPSLVLLCQVELAIAAAAFESRLGTTKGRGAAAGFRVATIAACVVLSWWWQIRPAVDAFRRPAPTARERLGFLATSVPQDAVVVTDLDTGWYVPAFGGKVIASRHPVAFVPDHAARIADVKRFFDASATRPERDAIVRRYGARFLIVDDGARRALPRDTFTPFGREVAASSRYRLIAIGE
jgi:hypothetical protein